MENTSEWPHISKNIDGDSEFSPCGPDGCELPPRYNQYETHRKSSTTIQKPVFHPNEYIQNGTNFASRYVHPSEYYREVPLPPIPMSPRPTTPQTVTHHIITSLHEPAPAIPTRRERRPVTLYQTITYSNYQNLESARSNIYPQHYPTVSNTNLNHHPMRSETISPPLSKPNFMEFNQSFQQRSFDDNLGRKFDDMASTHSGGSTLTQSFEDSDLQNVLAKHGGNALDFTEHERPT
ncbi:hypothetical protein HK096_002112 [Nowakowskiella sp. JEL0078]|nr:hypothetical protein HK096_002112 [Nowakowskiella sp. JEL0078]